MKKLILLFITTLAFGQATDPGYELPKPLPDTGPTPPTVIKPGGSYAPTAYNDARPGMYDVFVWGGHRSVGTLTERNAAQWKKEGMTCYVAETGKTYRLSASLIWVESDPGSDIIYLKDYGAIGDGVTDDTAALNLAIAAADNKILDIGKGLYLIGPVTINKPISIVGHHNYGQTGAATGPTSSQYSGFLRKTGTTGALITIDATVHGEMHYVYLSGNNVAGALNGLVINTGAAGGYVVDHVVSVNHTGSGLITGRNNTTVNNLTVARCTEYGVRVSEAFGSRFDNLQISSISGVGLRIDEGARYSRFSNLSILQCGATGVSIRANQIYIDGAVIGETGQSSLTFASSTTGTTNILVQDLITRNANCQIIPSLSGFVPEAEGTQASIYFDANNHMVSGIQFARCSINVPHPDSTVQATFGNRKASYCVNYVETVTPATAKQTFMDTYFEVDRTVSGAYPSWVPDRFVLINSSIPGVTARTHYFGTAATLGDSITVLKGIGTSPTAGDYPLVFNPTTKVVSANPVDYAMTGTWKTMPTKRIKYYHYETMPAAATGSTLGTGGWTATALNGGTISAPATLGHPSTIRIGTGAVPASGYTISSRSDMFSIDTNERYTYNILFRVPTVSTATDRFITTLGFGDVGAGPTVDGIQISVTDSTTEPTGSGNFRLKTSVNSVASFSDASAPCVANAWNAASITATTAAANMTVNGVAFPSITGANIPTGTTRAFGVIETIYAGSALTAARSVDIDWFEVIVEDVTQPWVPISNLQFFENMEMPWHKLVAFQLK